MDIESLRQVLNNATAYIETAMPGVIRDANHLARDLARIARLSAEGADTRGVTYAAAMDWDRIKQLVHSQRFEQLSPRERKAVVRRFLDFSPDHIRGLVREQPSLIGVYGRQLFVDWERGRERTRWREDLALIVESPEALPIRLAGLTSVRLLGDKGPDSVASLVRANSIDELFQNLTLTLGFSQRWSYTHRVVLSWLLTADASRTGLERILNDLVGWTQRAMLLPIRPVGTHDIQGSTGTKVATVSSVLARLHAEGAPVPPQLSNVLIHATFGDPRGALSAEWERVRTQSQGGFEAFTQSLVREDLKFFFTHAMKETDRGEFWLRYLSSIRRTICILDAESLRRVMSVAKGLDEQTQLAAARAMPMAGDGTVSAFCLVFDSCVAVEFSQTGNASFVYGREDFDRYVLPGTMRRPTIEGLKNREYAHARLTHQSNWQRKFRTELAGRGVWVR